MLRSLFTRRAGRAVSAVTIGVVAMTGVVAATSTAAWAKKAPKPTITSLSPTTVSPAGSQTVTITGTSLKVTGYTTSVTFGTTAGIVPTSDTATSVAFTTPAITANPNEAVTVVLKKGAATINSNAVIIKDVGSDYLPRRR